MVTAIASSREDAPSRSVVLRTVLAVAVAMLIADAGFIVLEVWMSSLPRPRTGGSLLPMRWLISFVVAANIGVLSAQIFLVVGYAALGEGRNLRRILSTTLVVVLTSYALAFFGMWWSRQSLADAAIIALMPTLVFFVLQIPFWGLRTFFGWIIVSPWADIPDRSSPRFSVANVLGWSAFLAVPLSILQIFTATEMGVDVQSVVAVISVGSVVCLLLVWFCYITLGTNLSLGKVAVATMSALLLAILSELVVLGILGGIEAEGIFIFAIMHLAASAIFLECLIHLRHFGFRLFPFAGRTSVEGSPRRGAETAETLSAPTDP